MQKDDQDTGRSDIDIQFTKSNAFPFENPLVDLFFYFSNIANARRSIYQTLSFILLMEKIGFEISCLLGQCLLILVVVLYVHLTCDLLRIFSIFYLSILEKIIAFNLSAI
jgi:hypothetical protein